MNYEVFQDWEEQALCESWAVFPLIFWVDSFSSLMLFLHACADWYQAQYLRKTHCRSLRVFSCLCCSPLSGTLSIIGAVVGLNPFVFQLSGLTLFWMMYCVLQTIVSYILSILGDCFRQESKFSPCYVVLARSGYGGCCSFHLFTCPLFMYLKFF